MIVKSVRALSLGKILGSIYGCLGLILGVILAGASLLGFGPVADATGPEHAVLGILMGGGAVIALPLVYGLFGLLGGLLVATIYNFVARFTGGLHLEVE